MNNNKSAYNAEIYDKNIVTVLPYYREYHSQIISLAKAAGIESPKWLDTGCGTGTLALRILEEIDGVNLTLCDPSEPMLCEAKKKLAGRDVKFLNMGSHQLDFEEEYDIITAVQSHHYFQPEERKQAVRNCYRALKKGGIFVCFENIRMSDPKSDGLALERWMSFLESCGNLPEIVEMHVARRGVEMFPITIEEHLEVLKGCGFSTVDLLWTSYLQAGFWAIK